MSEQKGSGKTAGHIPAETHEERQERSFKAAAHNPSNTHEGRLHAAQEMARIHKERTGEELDPVAEAAIGDKKAEELSKQEKQGGVQEE